MPRYVVLYHQTPPGSDRGSHWDLMLEHEGVLWTWALVAEPTQSQQAERLGDHRLAYLDYEGPISGDRGKVTRWDSGIYKVIASCDDGLTIEFSGGTQTGRIQLRRVAGATYDYSWQAA